MAGGGSVRATWLRLYARVCEVGPTLVPIIRRSPLSLDLPVSLSAATAAAGRAISYTTVVNPTAPPGIAAVCGLTSRAECRRPVCHNRFLLYSRFEVSLTEVATLMSSTDRRSTAATRRRAWRHTPHSNRRRNLISAAGIGDTSLKCRRRRRVAVDVAKWLGWRGMTLVLDHRRRDPHCKVLGPPCGSDYLLHRLPAAARVRNSKAEARPLYRCLQADSHGSSSAYRPLKVIAHMTYNSVHQFAFNNVALPLVGLHGMDSTTFGRAT